MSKKNQNHYSEEFKWRVVQQVLSGNLTKEEARKAYGIASNCAILYWMRQFSGNNNYREGGEVSLKKANIAEMKDLNKKDQRIQELEEELKRERVRGDLWQKVVELAEDELDIDIRKKYGAKQSIPSKSKKGKK